MLFKNKIISNDKKNIIYKSPYFIIFPDDNIPKSFNTFQSKCNKAYKKTGSQNIDFMYNMIPSNVKNDYIECFKILKLVNNLQNIVDEFSKLFSDKTNSRSFGPSIFCLFVKIYSF